MSLKEDIEGMRRTVKRRKQMLNDLKENRRCCKLEEEDEEEALDRSLWRTRLRRGYGFVARPTMK
jgi:hypothetical protein